MHSFSDVRPCVFLPLADTAQDPRAEPELPEAGTEMSEGCGIEFSGTSVGGTPGEPDNARWDGGFAQGYQYGLIQAREAQKRHTRRLKRLTHRVRVEAEAWATQLDVVVVQLALAVAERVVERELRSDREVILGVVRAALKEMRRTPVVRVRVHPEDYDVLAAHWEEVSPQAGSEHAQLVADEEVELGGCVIETRSGLADAQPRVKLAQIASAFESLLDGECP